MTEKLSIKTEKEFEQLMEAVDAELRAENINISARSITGWGRISARYGLALRMPAPKREPSAGCYVGYDLTIRIFRWFDERYGSKQNIDPTWRIAFMLRGDAYKMIIPLVFGSAQIICSKEEFGIIKPQNPANGSELPRINVLNLIDDFTESYAKSLSDDELLHIFNTFQMGLAAMNEISSISEELLVHEAIGDIHASITNLFVNPPQYGLSKWSSLQAAEKLLKSFINLKGQSFKQTHKLDELATSAESLGLAPIPSPYLTTIQCSPGVRYGSPTVSLNEAVESHQASLSLCLIIAKQIFLHKYYKQASNLEVGKYYTNSLDKEYRCISVNGEKASIMLFDQLNGKSLEVQFVQDKKYWSQYFEITDLATIQRLDTRYQKTLNATKQN